MSCISSEDSDGDSSDKSDRGKKPKSSSAVATRSQRQPPATKRSEGDFMKLIPVTLKEAPLDANERIVNQVAPDAMYDKDTLEEVLAAIQKFRDAEDEELI
ncbi:hypothetical protein PHYPSEUDO_013996 [Phytophthora pseudosyringae]|uniref:Uncharacterized protein n=1 Tax=Phytophthora pseudosyringae TaxID=221518 RepID=A0A8T1V7C7_9STRA|nr:hypothetical protein PHYPSEUDO_013996 [Phytophthora pseudosyringae]